MRNTVAGLGLLAGVMVGASMTARAAIVLD
jgi:hypothetical protein